jgi:hypothetical protein
MKTKSLVIPLAVPMGMGIVIQPVERAVGVFDAEAIAIVGT